MRFADRIVWITGASSGIGAALAAAFHRAGAHVVLSARREDALGRVWEGCAGGVGEGMIVPLDVTDEVALRDAHTRVIDRFGRIDILVNNAGLAQRALVKDTDMAVYRRLFEVNFFAAAALTKLVLPAMIERRSGHIVAVTSVAGKYSTPYRSGYNASKFAMHGFFDSLRAELAPDNVAVTLVVPGAIRTDISVNALRGDGSAYGRRTRIFEQGMDPADCATRILDAVFKKKNEVMIASGEARRLVLLQRFFPALTSRLVRLRKSR